MVTIADNGIGMDAQAMNELLEKNDRKRVESGVSIGILNVNARLKKIFGEQYGIHIESQAGEGTTVTITVPAIMEKNENAEQENAENLKAEARKAAQAEKLQKGGGSQ